VTKHVPIGQPDGSWRLLDFDPITGKTDWMKLEGDVEGRHQLKVRTVMPADELLAMAAAERQMDTGNWAGDMYRVSTMPIHSARAAAWRGDPSGRPEIYLSRPE
jgi:hypothetical protein